MSWEQLHNIQAENRSNRRLNEQQPPIACPIDGTILDVRGAIRNCPMGNFRWPRDEALLGRSL